MYFPGLEHSAQMPRYTSATGKISPSAVPPGTRMTDPFAVIPSDAVGNWSNLGPANQGGRTRALIIDPVTPNTMYAGGVAGGVWKSTNAGVTWATTNDQMTNLAIVTLAFQPGNSSVIYAGTGEGFGNVDAVRGAGIFKSTDAGVSWSQLASTNNSNFHYSNKILVSPRNNQRVWVATTIGIYRSLDGGANFTQVLNASAVGGCTDMAMQVQGASGFVFASCGRFGSQGTIHRADDSDASNFTSVMSLAGQSRSSIAVAPSLESTVYVMASQGSAGAGPGQYGLHGVYRSTSSGASGTWTTQRQGNVAPGTTAVKIQQLLLSNPIIALLTECGQGTSQFFNQGWYDNVLAVDPVDPNRVWAGGIDVWRSDNGGVDWGVASYWWFDKGVDTEYNHADQHGLVFHPNYNGTSNKILYSTNDGGIALTNDARASVNTTLAQLCGSPVAGGTVWVDRSSGYVTTQFYDGTVYPDGLTYFGGLQDNGTVRGFNGNLNWSVLRGGDGAYTALDTLNDANAANDVLFLANTGNSLQKSTDGGTSFAAANTGLSGSGFLFIAPFTMNESNRQHIWTGGFDIWRSANQAATWTRMTGANGTCGLGSISTIAAHPLDSNRVLVGMSDGCYHYNTTALTPVAGSWPGGSFIASGAISWMAWDPTNLSVAYATVSAFGVNNLLKTTNGGVSWAASVGTGLTALPQIPALSVVVNPNNAQQVFVGTDLGIYTSVDGGASWMVENTGFAKTPVESLKFNSAGTTLFAFTHGRGAWKSNLCSTCRTVGGNVSGLSAGNSVTLRINGGGDLTVAANGAFTFPDGLTTGDPYAVTVFTQPSAPVQTCVVTNGSGTIAGANVSNVTVTCTTTTFTVGGNVSGLAAGNSVVLRNNGGNDLTVAANGAFTFTTALTNGAAYAVTVFTQPTTPNQTCAVTNGSGNLAGANVTNVTVTCTTTTYTVSGTVAGLAAGNNVVLRNNGGNDLTVGANGVFTFSTALNDESAYAVTVFTQPTTPNQTCAVTNGSGNLAGANVTNVTVTCTTTTYTVGGSVAGLTAGNSVVLRNNGGNDLTVGANGAFTFSTALNDASAYAVTVFTQPTTPNQTCAVTNGSGNLAGANVTNVTVTCTTTTYTVGGSVAGLTAGNSVVLRNNGGNDLTVSANGAFTFTAPVADGAAYAVTVFTQPSAPTQNCVVTSGSGTIAGANVSNVTVTCTTTTFTVGGNVSGLATGNSVVLRNNGGNDLTVGANGAFTFSTTLTNGAAYAVTVFTQPTTPSQTCVVTNGSGNIAGANVSNVAVACTTNTYTIGGTVAGLATGNSVVLRNNGGNDLTVGANGVFAFSTALNDESAYAVTVFTQPTTPNQTCAVTNGSGNLAGANVTNVTVTCTTTTYTVGGSVAGLTAGNSVVLRNNGGNDLTLSANGAFTFTAPVADGAAYAVTVFTQPSAPTQNCVVTSGSGTIAGANVSNVTVTCTTTTFTVGGNVSGLAAGNSVVLRNNGGNDLTVGANGAFTFSTTLTNGAAYAVTVLTQPTTPSQTCVVTNGSGNIAGANVTNVGVACTTNTYTIGGTVAGLATGNSVVLRNNGGNDLTVGANGVFTFSTALNDESAYAVTVFTQPTTPNQTCAVTNGSGNLAGANVTNVTVTCTTTTYTVGGTVAGLAAGNSVVLRNNGGNDLTVSANGAFTFTAPVVDGAAYAVTVLTQPTTPSQTCVVTNGSGNVAGANVNNVAVACTTNTYTIGGTVAGLATGNSVVLRNNGGNDLTIAANGAFTFTTALTDESAYAVTVFTQPTTPNQTCVVTNDSGTLAGANVSNVTVACTTNSYTVGGTITGLPVGDSVTLRNNGGNDLIVSANGAFTFTTPIVDADSYVVTVQTQPSTPNRVCLVSSGSGTVAGVNVTSVVVDCVTDAMFSNGFE